MVLIEYKILHGGTKIREFDLLKPSPFASLDAKTGQIMVELQGFSGERIIDHYPIWDIVKIYTEKTESKLTDEEQQRYLDELKNLNTNEMFDPIHLNGEAHERGDDILCEILTKLGYPDIVELYNKRMKFYI